MALEARPLRRLRLRSALQCRTLSRMRHTHRGGKKITCHRVTTPESAIMSFVKGLWQIINLALVVGWAMSPILVITVCGRSPFHHGSDRIWVYCDKKFEIDLRDNRGYRAVFSCPAPILFLTSAALPVLWGTWICVRWPEVATFRVRRRIIMAMTATLAGWPAAIAYGGNPSDIGAHIGTHTIYALRSGRFDRAIAFEPEPRNARLLAMNLDANGLSDAVTVVPKAAGAAAGSAMLHLHPRNTGAHAIDVPPSNDGRDSSRYLLIAWPAACPRGTIRSFDPLPSTRTQPTCRFASRSFRPHSSLARRPDA